MLPRPYQTTSADAIASGSCGYLAFEQGLGKTLTALLAVKQLRARVVLVICPASVRLVWRDEIRKVFGKDAWINIPESAGAVAHMQPRPFQFLIVNFDKFSRGHAFTTAIAALGRIDLCVIDEAHYLKSILAKRTKAVLSDRGLRPHVRRYLLMSGTPAPSHVGELYSALRYCNPEAIRGPSGGVMTEIEFQDRFCAVDLRWIGQRLVRRVTGSKNVRELKERIGGWMIRKTKAELLPELPAIQFTRVPLSVSVPSSVRALADRIPAHVDGDELLALLRSDDTHLATQLRCLAIAKAMGAAEWLEDFLLSGDRKIVIWCQHHDVIDLLLRQLAPHEPVHIDGRCNQRRREEAVTRFLSDPACRVFIGQINSAGTGLTLLNEHVQPSDVFFISNSFVPGDNNQAAARVHRLGQRNAVLVRYFVADDFEIDVRVQRVLERKSTELAELF